MTNLAGVVSKEAFEKILPIFEQSRRYAIENDEARKLVQEIVTSDGLAKSPEWVAYRIIDIARTIEFEPGAHQQPKLRFSGRAPSIGGDFKPEYIRPEPPPVGAQNPSSVNKKA